MLGRTFALLKECYIHCNNLLEFIKYFPRIAKMNMHAVPGNPSEFTQDWQEKHKQINGSSFQRKIYYMKQVLFFTFCLSLFQVPVAKLKKIASAIKRASRHDQVPTISLLFYLQNKQGTSTAELNTINHGICGNQSVTRRD